MSNLFPVQTVAPLCASKSYALYRETESNVYTLYINDVMETDDLMDLRHALNDIKSLSLRHPYDYTIKLYINATAGTYAAYKILFPALAQHRAHLQAHIEYAYGYAAVLAMLAREVTIDVNAVYTLSFTFLTQRTSKDDTSIALWIHNILKDKLPKETITAIQAGKTIGFSVVELCNLQMVSAVYENDKRIPAKTYVESVAGIQQN